MISIPEWNIIDYPFPEDLQVSSRVFKYKKHIPIEVIRDTVVSILEEKGAGIAREMWGWVNDYRRDQVVATMDLEPYRMYSGRPSVPQSYQPLMDAIHPDREQLIRHSLVLFIHTGKKANISYLMGGRCETNGGGLLTYEYASDIKTNYYRQPDKAIRPGILLCLKNSKYLKDYVSEYRSMRIGDATAQDILIRFLGNGWFKTKHFQNSLKWWDNPPADSTEFQKKTIWRLHSAIMDSVGIAQPAVQMKLLGRLQEFWFHEFGVPELIG